MSRSMWFWLIKTVEVKSGEIFMKKKAFLIWVCCDTYKASKQLIVCGPRMLLKNAMLQKKYLISSYYWPRSMLPILQYKIWLQYFRQWSTWCMSIPKGSNQIKTNLQQRQQCPARACFIVGCLECLCGKKGF